MTIPKSHHGAWKGPNRLWLEGPEPARSSGTLVVEESLVRYRWSFQDKPHEGGIELFGPAAALRAVFKDSFHAPSGLALHGFAENDLIILFGTYPVGEGKPEWGWRIELDTRDPEHVTLRMFNVEPGAKPVPAVDLRGERA